MRHLDDLPAPRPLTDRQRMVLTTIAHYFAATGEPCSVLYLCRRLQLSRTRVRQHLDALHRKGWIPSPAAPRPRFHT